MSATISSNAIETHAPCLIRPGEALQALKIIRPVCEFAIDNEWLEHNPCRGIDDPVPRDNPKGRTTRPLSNEKRRILWNEMPPAVVRVLRLTILLGRRISEIALAERFDARLDQEPPVLVIPATGVGNEAKRDDAIPLPPLALNIIKEALTVRDLTAPLFIVGASDRGNSLVFLHGVSARQRVARPNASP